MLKNQLLYHLAKPFNHLYRFSIAKQVESMHQKNPSPIYNITPNILAMTDRKLLKVESHPLSIITQKIT